MIVLDTNVLVYAYHPQLEQHKIVARWLEHSLTKGNESIGLVWPVLSGFIRISTNRRVFETPMPINVAVQHVTKLFSHPLVQQLDTTHDHWKVFSSILSELGSGGDIVSDVHIAAIAKEHKASVATTDKDFRRFSDHVKIIDPMKK